MKFEGCVAAVTGAARGIGKAITKALLQKKVKVYFMDVDTVEGNNVQQEFDEMFGKGLATFYPCNVANTDEFTDALSQIAKENGRLDILCNNAGIGPTQDFQKLIDINLTAMIQGTKFAIKLMDTSKGGKGGNVINVSSITGLTFLESSDPAYLASKHGVVAFTRSMAQTAIKFGVRLNCICPSAVDTKLFRESMNISDIKEVIDSHGIKVQSPDVVGKGFLQLLEDEDKIGEAMRITSQNGIDFHPFSQEPVPY